MVLTLSGIPGRGCRGKYVRGPNSWRSGRTIACDFSDARGAAPMSNGFGDAWPIRFWPLKVVVRSRTQISEASSKKTAEALQCQTVRRRHLRPSPRRPSRSLMPSPSRLAASPVFAAVSLACEPPNASYPRFRHSKMRPPFFTNRPISIKKQAYDSLTHGTICREGNHGA